MKLALKNGAVEGIRGPNLLVNRLLFRWFETHKQDNGIYEVSVMAGAKYKDVKYWITLQYLNVLNRLNRCE